MQTVEPKFPMKVICQPGPRANSAVGRGGLSAHRPHHCSCGNWLPGKLRFLWDLEALQNQATSMLSPGESLDVGCGDPKLPPSGSRMSFPKVETGSAQHRWPAGPLLQEAMPCGTVRSRLGFSDRRLPRASCSRLLSHLEVHTLSQRWGRRVLWLSLPCLSHVPSHPFPRVAQKAGSLRPSSWASLP